MSRRNPPSASPSTSAIIVGVIMLGIVGGYFFMADTFNLSTEENNFINTLFTYVVLVGLISLGAGIGIKAYHWRKP